MVNKKRYNLQLPTTMFDEVEALAEQEQATQVEILKKLIKVGLTLWPHLKDPDTTIIVKRDGTEQGFKFIV